ncbi:hypothetical protein MCETWHM1_01271 [Candidatus Methylopumilus planktonicus]|uniref:hypothetical protein n=1 Tax=Candidatus Methylopumilus planktonicus TaxID=1581557 RepID=UPI003BEEC1D1
MLQKLKIKANVEILFLFLLFILCDTATQIFLKKGATNLGEIPLDQLSHIIIYVLNILTNANIIIGFSLFAISIKSCKVKLGDAMTEVLRLKLIKTIYRIFFRFFNMLQKIILGLIDFNTDSRGFNP